MSARELREWWLGGSYDKEMGKWVLESRAPDVRRKVLIIEEGGDGGHVERAVPREARHLGVPGMSARPGSRGSQADMASELVQGSTVTLPLWPLFEL